jgi:hypothetical protein
MPHAREARRSGGTGRGAGAGMAGRRAACCLAARHAVSRVAHQEFKVIKVSASSSAQGRRCTRTPVPGGHHTLAAGPGVLRYRSSAHQRYSLITQPRSTKAKAAVGSVASAGSSPSSSILTHQHGRRGTRIAYLHTGTCFRVAPGPRPTPATAPATAPPVDHASVQDRLPGARPVRPTCLPPPTKLRPASHLATRAEDF